MNTTLGFAILAVGFLVGAAVGILGSVFLFTGSRSLQSINEKAPNDLHRM